MNLSDEYIAYSPITVGLSGVIVDKWKSLGKPTDLFTPSGNQMMHFIIHTWATMYPDDAADWTRHRTEHLNSEMSITEQVHQHTGRSLASFPPYIYKIMKRIFTDNKWNRETFIKMVKLYPIFRFANHV